MLEMRHHMFVALGAGTQASWMTSSMKKALRQGEENADDVVCITDDSDEDAAAGGRVGQKARVSVEGIERLMLWQEPLQTTKVFGVGLYVLICLRHLVNGQPCPRASVRHHA